MCVVLHIFPQCSGAVQQWWSPDTKIIATIETSQLCCSTVAKWKWTELMILDTTIRILKY